MSKLNENLDLRVKRRASAGLFAVYLVQAACLSAVAQHESKPVPRTTTAGTPVGQITVERVSTEPDQGPQVRSDAGRQAPLLHWSADGMRVAWLKLVPPPAHSVVKTPQQEIWFLQTSATTNQETGTRSDASAAKPAVLVTAARVTASLRGTSTPRPLSIDDDDKSNPDLLRNFAWAPDHSALLLVSGQSLAWLDLASGKSRVLLTGEEALEDAMIAPDGKTISFLRNHTLWTINVSGGAPRRLLPTTARPDVLAGELDWPYRNELLTKHGYAWSPDSSRIAYLETDDRATDKYTLRASDGATSQIVYPKAGGKLPVVRVFVKAIGIGLPVEMKLGGAASTEKDCYLPRFTWLPDGRHLAIERLDRRQHTLDLFLADAVTGRTQLILSEKDDYWINLFDEPVFLKDGKRFVWSSERTGYRHLYLYDIAGKQLAQLTHGDWEVTELNAVDEGLSRVYFTATEKSPLQRQVYAVSLAGEDLTQITQMPGTHEAYFASDTTHYLDSYSSQSTPPRMAMVQIGSRTDGGNQPGQSQSTEDVPNLLPVEFLTVKLHMGLDVHAFMIKPQDFDASRKYPVIVCLAGGPGEQLVRDKWGGATGLWMQLMAQKGYIVFALDGQGTAGRGHYFEEPLHFRLSAQEMIDQRDGLSYLGTLPYVDSERLGVWGWGYGGFLVIHGMLDRPVAFKAGFAGAPIVDWHFYDAVFAERYLDDPVAHQDGWLSSVALENARYFKGPLLIAQGTADEFVHVENALTLQDNLLDAGKSAETLLLPDRGHRIEDAPARLVLFRRITDFFLKNL